MNEYLKKEAVAEKIFAAEVAKELQRLYREGVHDGFAKGILRGIELAKTELNVDSVLPCHNYTGLAERAIWTAKQASENEH